MACAFCLETENVKLSFNCHSKNPAAPIFVVKKTKDLWTVAMTERFEDAEILIPLEYFLTFVKGLLVFIFK